MSDQAQNNFSTSFIVVFTTIKNCSSPVLPRLVRQRTTRDPRIYSGRSSTEASITPGLKLNTLLGKASRCCQLSLVAGPTALRFQSLPCVYDQRTSRRRKNLGFTQEAANLVCRHIPWGNHIEEEEVPPFSSSTLLQIINPAVQRYWVVKQSSTTQQVELHSVVDQNSYPVLIIVHHVLFFTFTGKIHSIHWNNLIYSLLLSLYFGILTQYSTVSFVYCRDSAIAAISQNPHKLGVENLFAIVWFLHVAFLTR